MTEDQAQTDLACMRLLCRDVVAHALAQRIDPFMVGLALTLAGTDLITSVAGPGAAYQVAEGAKARVDRAMVAPDGKRH